MLRLTKVCKLYVLEETCKTLVKTLIRMVMNRLQLSIRAYHRVLRLACSIANLAGSKTIQVPYLAEALQYLPRLNML
jgi:magnesium chelatase family protein